MAKDEIWFSLGPVGKLKELGDVVVPSKGEKTKILTPEAFLSERGGRYDDDCIVIIRSIEGEVIKDGLYDIFVLPPDKAEECLRNEVDVRSLLLTEKQKKELAPILAIAYEVRAYRIE